MAKILEKALREEILDGNEVVFLLSLERESQIDAVFRTAREMRSRYFGNRIFLYGFVYLSTYCRNECNFCYFRKSNALPDRYRREVSEV
ncbi:MAG: methylornithine synthase PylB, partial [Deltaproteobacteria bacterium]|nr:methylornithine synthase PylB [Deltaproteobacteria bacterium]